jgi:hypothetical protein
MMPQIRAAVRSCTAPGKGPDTHKMSPSGLAMTCRFIPCCRHACLSTWLNGGVYPTQVAEWAGHGVDVLLRIYAKCVAGQDELAKRRISEALLQDL